MGYPQRKEARDKQDVPKNPNIERHANTRASKPSSLYLYKNH